MPGRNDFAGVSEDRAIVVTHIFDAPRAVIFEAWTKPEHVTRWWDPSGTPLAVCEIDLRPHGAFRWVHGTPGAEAWPFTGTYWEITAPERLIFTARISPGSPDALSTLVFSEIGRQTKLTMTIECQSTTDRDGMLALHIDVGTWRTLENLARYASMMPSPARA